KEITIIQNKCRFIKMINSNELQISKQTKDQIINQLLDLQFDPILTESSKLEGSFDYLLNIPISNLSIDNVEKLEKQLHEKEKLLNEIQEKDVKQMWREDLLQLRKELLDS